MSDRDYRVGFWVLLVLMATRGCSDATLHVAYRVFGDAAVQRLVNQ